MNDAISRSLDGVLQDQRFASRRPENQRPPIRKAEPARRMAEPSTILCNSTIEYAPFVVNLLGPTELRQKGPGWAYSPVKRALVRRPRERLAPLGSSDSRGLRP